MLLSNSLFLDTEYKADCEYKINYLNFLKNIEDSSFNDIPEDKNSDGKISRDEIISTVESRLSNDQYINDGTNILYKNKQISDNYYKILLENHQKQSESN